MEDRKFSTPSASSSTANISFNPIPITSSSQSPLVKLSLHPSTTNSSNSINNKKAFNSKMYDFILHSKTKNHHLQEKISHTWINPIPNKESMNFHNSACEICMRFTTFSRDVYQCMYCNVVCHVACLEDTPLKADGASKGKGEDASGKQWICFYCQDSLQYDQKLHETILNMEEYERVMTQSQIIISKYWRRYSNRSWYIRVYSAIVRLQIQFQVRKRKRLFLHSVQAKLRTIKVKVTHIVQLFLLDREAKIIHASHSPSHSSPHSSSHSPNHTKTKLKKREYNIYLIVTVYDLTQGTSVQTWRIESPLITVQVLPLTLPDILLDEKFILGGVSGFQHLVISIFQKGVVRDIFLGQASVELANNQYWKKGGKFTSVLLPCGYELKDAAGMDFKADYRFSPKGSIQFEIITSHSMNAECCSCYGTSVEDILRTLHQLPDTTGFYIPIKKLTTGGKLNPIHGGGMAAVSSQSSVGSSSVNGRGGGGSSVGGSSVATTASVVVDTTGTAMKKMWIAVTEGKLFIFGHFGDQLKLSIDLQYFSIGFEFGKGNNIIYKIYRIGYPQFDFYPVYDHEIFRMKCAFLASLRYAKGFAISSNLLHHTAANNTVSQVGGRHQRLMSTLGTASSSDHHTTLGAATAIGEKFDVSYLVSDLLALEIMKNRTLQQKREASSSFHLGGGSSRRGTDGNRFLSNPHVRNSIQLSPIKKSSSRNSVDFASRGMKNLLSVSKDDTAFIPDSNNNNRKNSVTIQTSKDSFDADEGGKEMKPFVTARKTGEIRGGKGLKASQSESRMNTMTQNPSSTMRKSLTEKAITRLVQNYENGNTEEARDEIQQQLITELTMEEVAASQRLQSLGDIFMKNLIIEKTEQKIQEQFKLNN